MLLHFINTFAFHSSLLSIRSIAVSLIYLICFKLWLILVIFCLMLSEIFPIRMVSGESLKSWTVILNDWWTNPESSIVILTLDLLTEFILRWSKSNPSNGRSIRTVFWFSRWMEFKFPPPNEMPLIFCASANPDRINKPARKNDRIRINLQSILLFWSAEIKINQCSKCHHQA